MTTREEGLANCKTVLRAAAKVLEVLGTDVDVLRRVDASISMNSFSAYGQSELLEALEEHIENGMRGVAQMQTIELACDIADMLSLESEPENEWQEIIEAFKEESNE